MLWNTACLIFILLHIIFSSFSMAVTNQKLAKSINGACKSWQTKQIIVILEYSQLAYQSNFKWRKQSEGVFSTETKTLNVLLANAGYLSFAGDHLNIFTSLKKISFLNFPFNLLRGYSNNLKVFVWCLFLFHNFFLSEWILTFSIERSQKIQLGLT